MQLYIHGFSHDGRGIGRVTDKGKRFGKTCFVSGALPEETVTVSVTRENRRMIEAELVSVDVAHPQRQDPPCPYVNQCGGCQLQHGEVALQRQLKKHVLSEQFRRLAGIEVDVGDIDGLYSQPWHSRRRMRFGVKGESLGLKASGSNKLVDIKQCLIGDTRINDHLPAIKGLVAKIPSLSGIEVIANEPIVVALQSKAPLTLSAWVSEYCQRQQLSLYQDGQHLAGPVSQLSYDLNGIEIQHGPQHFSQVNGEINQKMVAQALDWLAPKADQRVLDLFCGVGNFALAFAPYVGHVVGIEGSAQSIEQAKHNARLNVLDNSEFIVEDLFQPSGKWLQEAADIVLLDPPRAGAQAVIEQFAWLGSEVILYVSCDPATLARDAKLLAGKGFSLVKLSMMDMFSHTRHIEAMAMFVSSRNRSQHG